MKVTLACSATLVAAILLWLPGCGGGGGKGETPPTATTMPAPPAPAAGGPTTTVAGGEGEEDEESPLLAWADGEPEEGKAPLTVEFKADTEGGKAPLKYTWKFGDGSPDSNEQNPKHVYAKAGKYRADLEVADSAGDSDSDYIEVEVQ
jgi:PKD repeat protein